MFSNVSPFRDRASEIGMAYVRDGKEEPMEIKKPAPWNCFKKEEEDAGFSVCSPRPGTRTGAASGRPLIRALSASPRRARRSRTRR